MVDQETMRPSLVRRSSGSGEDESDAGEAVLLPPLSSELGSPSRTMGRSSRHNSGESALTAGSRPLSPLPFFTGASSIGDKASRFDFDATRPQSPMAAAAATSGSVPTTPVRALPTAPAPVRSLSLIANPLAAGSAAATSSSGTCSGRRRPRTVSMSHVGKSTMIQTSSRTIYTAGRPPWYDSEGTIKDAFIIGICGGSASGKTTVAKNIIEALDVPWVALLSMDSFYNVFNEEQRELAAKNDFNFDHPDAFDINLVVETLRKLKEGKQVSIPIYNFHTHSREKQQKAIYGANVIIFEGIMAFAHKSLLELMDMKIFVDTDSDIRLARRLRRDTVERGRDIHGVLQQYERFVKPAFEHYIEPTMMHADIIIPRGGENAVACHLVVQHVHTQLKNRGFQLRQQLRSCHAGQPLPSNFYQLESTPQIKGLHTIIRNRDTPRDEFVFYSARLMRLLVEFALSFLPHETVEIETPQGINYIGQRVEHKSEVCGVSILRAGEVMEPALTSICKDVRLGKILIQTNLLSGEPELYYLRLPRGIDQGWVFLMEATIATGAAAMMAIRVLLDHDVKEDRIVLLSLLMAESGIHSIAYAFPRVKILTTAYDPDIDELFHIIPGIGNFGDRYFGTDD